MAKTLLITVGWKMSDSNNFWQNNQQNDNEDDPNSLLVQRLIKVEEEMKAWKEAYYLCNNYLNISSESLRGVVESLPEPIILNEIIELIDDPNYKQYLRDSSTLIDYYKTTLMITDMNILKYSLDLNPNQEKGENI